jgi:hypothetical protein
LPPAPLRSTRAQQGGRVDLLPTSDAAEADAIAARRDISDRADANFARSSCAPASA